MICSKIEGMELLKLQFSKDQPAVRETAGFY